MTPRSPKSREQGSAIFLITGSLLLLLGFAAIALDLAGSGFNERRQHQSAADVGALAAVQFAVPRDIGNAACAGFSGIALSRCNGASEAIEIASATLDSPGLSDWTDASSCSTPPDDTSGNPYTVSPISNCVAFNSNNQRAWVQIPVVQQPTRFARAIGFDSINVSASAIAGAQLGNPGAVLPFLLPGNAANENYNCLKTSGNPNFGPCEDLPTTGNFGAMDFFLYGNEDLGWTQQCSGDTNGRFATNIARGVDHPLGFHPTGVGGGILEDSACPDYSAQPNMAKAQPGSGSAFEQGMLYGGSSYATNPYDGRIEDAGGYVVRNAQGPNPQARIDNVPLWDYLLADPPGTDCDGVSTPAQMTTCIEWAKSTGTVVFSEGANGLVTAQRFGWTPLIWEAELLTPGYDYHLKGYIPVYIDTTFYACTSTDCTIMHTPGVADSGSCPASPPDVRITCGTPGNGNRSLVASTAYVLSLDIIPDEAKAPSPGSANQRAYSLVK